MSQPAYFLFHAPVLMLFFVPLCVYALAYGTVLLNMGGVNGVKRGADVAFYNQ